MTDFTLPARLPAALPSPHNDLRDLVFMLGIRCAICHGTAVQHGRNGECVLLRSSWRPFGGLG